MVWLGAIIKQVIMWYPCDDQISMVFEVLVTVLLMIAVLWGILLCCWVNGYWCFQGTVGPHLHGQAVFFITLLQLLAPNNENTTVLQTLQTICSMTSHPRRQCKWRAGFWIVGFNSILIRVFGWEIFTVFSMKVSNLIWIFWPGGVACQCVSYTFMLSLWRSSNTLGHSS
jgi:hypothetical protein